MTGSRGMEGEPATVLAGRYRLGALLGSGGSGTVWRGTDALTGAAVAVKVLSPRSPTAAKQLRREMVALRVLQMPGVVSLLDHGAHEGRPYLVMALVEGRPFPGPRFDGTWASLAPTTCALLETLARIHAAGIVHRDLKPENVLVDADGRPTVLDLGLAHGGTLGGTDSDATAGTPRWQAPEQMMGAAVGARADLYAIGVMLFEALAGAPPHPVDTKERLTFARIMRDAPLLAAVAPGVPEDVARLVVRLLARPPEQRPRAATEALAALRGCMRDDDALPHLGPRRAGPLADDLLAGRARDVVGPPGSGRTRLVGEVAELVERAGRRVVRLRPAERPFASLEPLAAGLADEDAVGPALERRIRATLAEGTAIVADDAERLDPWSGALLEACRPAGAVLRTLGEGDGPAVRLAPLSEEDLRALFVGRDRFLHLQEDGARELYARTGGWPGRVEEEVGRWVGAGLARWEGRRLALDRHALDRLEAGLRFDTLRWDADVAPLLPPLEELLAWATLAWPHATPELLADVAGSAGWEVQLELRELERLGAIRLLPDGRVEPRRPAAAIQGWSADRRREAHAVLAGRLAPGTEGRLQHLVGARDMAGAAMEARVLARALAVDGRAGRALAALEQGLAAAREAEDAALESHLLEEYARVALAESTPAALKLAAYEVGRATGPLEGDAAGLAPLLRAWLAWMMGAPAETVEAAGRDVAPFRDEDLECWRRAREVAIALRAVDLDAADAVVDAAADWAERGGTMLARGRVLGWKGLVHYRRGAHAEAARCHGAAIPLKTTVPDRLTSMLNAVMAEMERGDVAVALRLAQEAGALARERRLPNYEGRAAALARAAAIKCGGDLSPDPELPDALSGLVGAGNVGAACLWEGGLAWLTGDLPLARTLAARGVDLYRPLNLPDGEAPCRALLLLCTSGRTRADAAPILDLLPRCSPETALGTLGLLALAFPVDGDPEWAARAEALYPRVPARLRHVPADVLSPAEALAHCRSLARRAPL